MVLIREVAMRSLDKFGRNGKGLKILVVHAPGCPPDEAAFTKLLSDARLDVADLEFTTSADIANGMISPEAFDRVLAILGDEMGADEHLESSMLGIARSGMSVLGLWDKDAVSNEMHPAVRKYGDTQIPWNPESLFQAIFHKTPQMFQSPVGGQTTHHKTTHNKC